MRNCLKVRKKVPKTREKNQPQVRLKCGIFVIFAALPPSSRVSSFRCESLFCDIFSPLFDLLEKQSIASSCTPSFVCSAAAVKRRDWLSVVCRGHSGWEGGGRTTKQPADGQSTRDPELPRAGLLPPAPRGRRPPGSLGVRLSVSQRRRTLVWFSGSDHKPICPTDRVDNLIIRRGCFLGFTSMFLIHANLFSKVSQDAKFLFCRGVTTSSLLSLLSSCRLAAS